MSAQQQTLSPEEMKTRVEETHKALTRHFAELGKRYADLAVDGQSWTTRSASGGIIYVFGYMRVSCDLSFPGGVGLNFVGNGIAVGLGGTGSIGGQATFNVDPSTLKGASGISFEAYAVSVGIGGFQITWYKNGGYIGHGEFWGAGIQGDTPGGGWGAFS